MARRPGPFAIGTMCSMMGASTKAGGYIAAACKQIYNIEDGPGTPEEKAEQKLRTARELEGVVAAATGSPKDVFAAHAVMAEIGAYT